jgi:hypothetical protein
MAKIIFGNPSSVLVPEKERDNIRKFYCDILGGRITKADDERDFVCLGDNFYICFLYGDVPDEGVFLRTARSIWLEIKSDNVEEVKQKILDFGVRSLRYWTHTSFSAPGTMPVVNGIHEDSVFMRDRRRPHVAR